MQIQEGFSYHIKNKFFIKFNIKKFMKNKEKGNYRPYYYAIEYKNNPKLLWMIPISSKFEKYLSLLKIKKEKYGRCDTIVLGYFSGRKCAFLIQNAFLTQKEYLEHIHTVNGKPVLVHKKFQNEINFKLNKLIILKEKGINLFYVDIDEILSKIK